jgi:hypothetical protein
MCILDLYVDIVVVMCHDSLSCGGTEYNVLLPLYTRTHKKKKNALVIRGLFCRGGSLQKVSDKPS